LTVPDGASIIPAINSLAELDGWAFVAYTMDYHPPNHASFADNSPFEKNPFDFVDMAYDEQGRICGEEYVSMYGPSANSNCSEEDVVSKFSQHLWPVHCVQGTWGQNLDDKITLPAMHTLIRKGITSVADSYGAFENNIIFLKGNLSDSDESKQLTNLEMVSQSSLEALLMTAGVSNVYIAGLALDYCVKYTALQATDRQFNTYLIEDAAKPVDAAQGEEAIHELEDHGVRMVSASEVPVNHLHP